MTENESRTLSDKFMLRLPDGMREQIRAEAEANHRSMNAEIVAALDEWLSKRMATALKKKLDDTNAQYEHIGRRSLVLDRRLDALEGHLKTLDSISEILKRIEAKE